MARVLHISDTHGFHGTFPDSRLEGVDIIVHSGDCSNLKDPYRNANEVLDFLAWYSSLPVPHKVFVAGNHDSSIERGLVTPAQFAEAGITYLQDSGADIMGLRFWGTPWTPTFNDWSFMRARHKMKKVWDMVPADTQVLVTHGPPKGVRDLSFDREGDLEMCGDKSLMNLCLDLKSLRAVMFGHIHNMSGIDTNQGTSRYSFSDAVFSNGACVYDGKWDYGLTSHGNMIDL